MKALARALLSTAISAAIHPPMEFPTTVTSGSSSASIRAAYSSARPRTEFSQSGLAVPANPGCVGVITRAGWAASMSAKALIVSGPPPPCRRRNGGPSPRSATVTSTLPRFATGTSYLPVIVLISRFYISTFRYASLDVGYPDAVPTSLQDLGRAVKQLQYRHHRGMDSRLRAAGTSLPQWDALRAISRRPSSSAHALAEMTFQTDQSFGAL